MAKQESTSTSWEGVWNQKDFCKGDGFTGVGNVVQTRFHSVTSKSDILRYTAVVIDVKNVHKRSYSKYGTGNRVYDGSSSFPEVELAWRTNPGGPTKVTSDQLAQSIGTNGGNAAKLLGNALLAKVHPKVKDRFEFWMDFDAAKKVGLENNLEVSFKTEGDSIFLVDLRRTAGAFSQYGENAKVLNQISKISDNHTSDDKPLKQDQLEGVDESEWDD